MRAAMPCAGRNPNGIAPPRVQRCPCFKRVRTNLVSSELASSGRLAAGAIGDGMQSKQRELEESAERSRLDRAGVSASESERAADADIRVRYCFKGHSA